MKLTQELIDKIQEAMLHTNLKGEINWKDGDDIKVQIAGTFAKDKFIVLKNASKNPFENAQPHPYFDYEKKVFTKDGREEYMKELKKNDTSNEYAVVVGDTDAVFTFNFSVENINIIAGAYDVIISSKLLSEFTNKQYNLKYFIALEPDSTFG